MTERTQSGPRGLTTTASAALQRHYGGPIVGNHVPFIAVVIMTAVLGTLGYAMNHTSYLVWGAFWVAPTLLLLSLPIARRAAKLDGDRIGRIVLAAAAVKILVAPLGLYWMAFGIYASGADAARYHRAGELLAPLFRQGIYRDLGDVYGTRFIEIVTGQVYALIGTTSLGGFMVFSWLSFLGFYMFYRAFRTAYPEGDGRRYALLIFFFPTLLFWPSGIGKDAFMVLSLGGAALGAAQLLVGRFRGLVWLAFGLAGAAVVRPHMALIVGAGLIVAAPLALLRGGAHGGGQRWRGRLGSAALILALLVGGSALITVAENFFGMDSLNTQTAREQLDETIRQSGYSGSTFTSVSPNSPIGFALACMNVLFRPFPFEAHNLQAMLTSLEGVVLLGFIVVALRRLVRLPLELLRRPYVTFAFVYSAAFIYAFSSIVNFGILARQRSQLLPVLFVVLCLRKPERSADAPGEDDIAEPVPAQPERIKVSAHLR